MARGAIVLLTAGLSSAALLAAAPVTAQQLDGVTVQGRVSTEVCCVVPVGAEVAVELVNPVNTRIQKAGQVFDIRLAAPLIVDGRIILPAGTTGVGRVVQSSGPGIGGKGAKLVVSAEYLNVPGGGVKLSGMQLTGTGKDHSMAANVLGLGGIAFAPIGVAGILMTGDHIEIPAGTAARARIAEQVILPPVAAATSRDYADVSNMFGVQPRSRGWLDVPRPPEGMGQVVFFRKKSMTGIQWFSVREKGEALAKLNSGTYFIVALPPGEHEFTARSEPELKDHLTLKVDAGETYYVESVMTHGLVLGAADLTPSDKARFDTVSADLKPAEVKTAAN